MRDSLKSGYGLCIEIDAYVLPPRIDGETRPSYAMTGKGDCFCVRRYRGKPDEDETEYNGSFCIQRHFLNLLCWIAASPS
jgi:hypothetical protein